MSLNFNQIYNLDCIDGLRQIETATIDMIFADPPFNVGKKYGKDDTKDNRSDYYEWCDQWIDEGFRVLKDTGSFCLMTIPRHLEKKFPMMGKRGVFINLINWRNVSASHDKRRFWGSTQPILLYGKTEKYKFHQYGEVRRIPKENQRWGGYTTCAKGQLLDYWCDIPFVYSGSVKHKEAIMEPGTNSKAHPAQMPIGLPERFIKFLTDENDVVLDPFMGTGTTAIAAIKTSRQFIGFEINKKYFGDAQKRIVEAQGQGKLTGKWFE